MKPTCQKAYHIQMRIQIERDRTATEAVAEKSLPWLVNDLDETPLRQEVAGLLMDSQPHKLGNI